MLRKVISISCLILWIWGIRYFFDHPHLAESLLRKSLGAEQAISSLTEDGNSFLAEPDHVRSSTEALAASPTNSASLSIHERPAGQGQTGCSSVPTQPISRSQGPIVYRWTDEAGGVRFSDRPPAGIEAESVLTGQASQPQYFLLNVNYLGRDPIPFLRAQVRTDTTRIFQIISGLTGQELLRQVELNIRIFQEREAYKQYAASAGRRSSANAGGFYTTSTNEVVTHQYPDDKTTLRVLRHESLHVIMAGIIGTGAPLWLNEGLAVYFEQLYVAAQYGEVAANPAWLAVANEALGRGYPATLRNLLTLKADAWYDSPEAQSHYSLAATLVFFLLDSVEGRSALTDLLRTQASSPCTTVNQAEWLLRSYPGGASGLERDFLLWLRSNPEQKIHRY
jgi:hypothetical protein